MVAHDCKPSTWEAEGREDGLRVRGRPEVLKKFHATQWDSVREWGLEDGEKETMTSVLLGLL